MNKIRSLPSYRIHTQRKATNTNMSISSSTTPFHRSDDISFRKPSIMRSSSNLKQDSFEALSVSQLQPSTFYHHRRFANPAPLGLSAFAATTFLLSLFNLQTRGITTPNLIVGIALSYGGLVQLLAGMWEFAAGNTFGATAFSSYGGFWISFGLIFWPSSGILSSYTGHTSGQLDQALGLYLITWFVFTFILLVASLRSSVALVGLFFFLDITFLLLGLGKVYPTIPIFTKVGAIFGLVTSGIAWYTAAANLLTSETSYFLLPVIDLSSSSIQRD